LCSASFVVVVAAAALVVVVNSFTDLWIAALRRHERFFLHGELFFSNAYKKSLALVVATVFVLCSCLRNFFAYRPLLWSTTLSF
jgi:hypothetical protein